MKLREDGALLGQVLDGATRNVANPVPQDLFMECQIKTSTGEITSSLVPLSNCVHFLHNFVEHIESDSNTGLMDTPLRELQ